MKEECKSEGGLLKGCNPCRVVKGDRRKVMGVVNGRKKGCRRFVLQGLG